MICFCYAEGCEERNRYSAFECEGHRSWKICELFYSDITCMMLHKS